MRTSRTPQERGTDDLPASRSAAAKCGIPPQVRERHHEQPGQPGDDRNAAAGAGTTPAASWRSRTCGEHPRRCGDDTATASRTPRDPEEHPRKRGDDLKVGYLDRAAGGTPPQARGRRLDLEQRGGDRWNTPASAGTTRGRTGGRGRPGEHPRKRGDDPGRGLQGTVTGTPPQARGRPLHGGANAAESRNTPASAGTTAPQRGSGPCAREHPRKRGDDTREDSLAGLFTGTPPQARGRRANGVHGGAERGNTPASAGTTTSSGMRSRVTQEHPRKRGDDGITHDVERGALGTPPQARGRQLIRQHGVLARRNTPASAGTTRMRPPTDRPTAEHPRKRGDDDGAPRSDDVHAGTPPQARGRRADGRPRRRLHGNTPASAGTTPRCSPRTTTPTEHPRKRGDDLAGARGEPRAGGTPPQARGRLREAA